LAIQGVSDIEVISHLGTGSFGTVSSGTLQPHGAVAIKEIDCKRMSRDLGVSDWNLLRDYLYREAENLRKAEHANVVRVYSVHYDDPKEHIYIVTELCDDSLETAAALGPLPLNVVHQYVRDALLGLEALHVRGMLHRDIKPGNILLKGPTAKLSDFGLVSDHLIAGYASHQGYVDHLAPEVLKDDRTSSKSDVWAMGLTVYRLLNGEPWYRDHQKVLGIDWSLPGMKSHVQGLILAGRFAAKLPWLPHVPEAWRRFVRCAMNDNPSKRFENGGAMLTAHGSLPRGPTWDCKVTGGNVNWKRTSKTGREELAELRTVAPGKVEFRGFSRPSPSKTGRELVHVVTKRPVKLKDALKKLQAFFATRT
jgi:eukaryotic-like serine/threonine-protein kinase